MTFAASTRHDGEVSFMDVCERSVQHRLETCYTFINVLKNSVVAKITFRL
jgi:hypothetical protein